MVFSSAFYGTAALVSACLMSPAAAGDPMPLPWDGLMSDLTTDKVTDKYLTHILTMRSGGAEGKASDYVEIVSDGRTPAYNGDTGIANIGVDDKAIFKEQVTFRRAELVQFVETSPTGTFIRASMRKEEDFLNAHVWQMIFPEEAQFQIRVDATKKPHQLIYINNGTWEAKWDTEFALKTWYNFGINIAAGPEGKGCVIDFSMSEGDAELTHVAKHHTVSNFTSSLELHIGLLTLSEDDTPPQMSPEKDIVSFSGVTVEAKQQDDAPPATPDSPTTPGSPTTPAGTPPAAPRPAGTGPYPNGPPPPDPENYPEDGTTPPPYLPEDGTTPPPYVPEGETTPPPFVPEGDTTPPPAVPGPGTVSTKPKEERSFDFDRK